MSLPYTFVPGTTIYASQVNANFAAVALADLSNVSGSIGVTAGGTGTTTVFTAGSLLFAGASGVYSQNNAQLFWDNTNYRLGLGTASPSATLDVRGNINGGQTVTTGYGVSTADASLLIGGARTGNGNAFLGLYANGSSSASAQVYRATGANGALTLSNTGTGALTIQQTNSANILLSINGSTIVTVLSSGNVGIGNTSPSYTLDVSGTIRSTGGFTGNVTGNLSGTASTATNANYATSAGSATNANYATSAGSATSATTASALTVGNSYTMAGLTVTGGTSVNTLAINNSQGQFSMTNTSTSGGRSLRIADGSSADIQVVNSAYSAVTHVFGDNGDFIVGGTLYKAGGSFKISHPLPELAETHDLVHSFVEAPQADLIYTGTAVVRGGSAEINLDEAAGMTEGTFALLCRNVRVFTTNESSWVAVRGSVKGNRLTIKVQDAKATPTVSWLVVGERQDPHMFGPHSWTDETGRVVVEPLKAPTNFQPARTAV